MKKTMLDRARKISVAARNPIMITPEHVAMAVAYVRGEISYTAAQKGGGFPKGNGSYVVMLRALRQAVANGKVALQIKK